jgi:thioredoxin-like negative regulator of GroEL
MALASAGSKGGSKVCSHTGFYSKKIVPMCEKHFPEAYSKNEWLVIFYHPFVQKVHEARESFEEIAALGDKQLGAKVGAVDCKENNEFCMAQGIREVPTTRIISSGRARDFEGEHTKEKLQAFISESVKRFKEMDEALKCEVKGLFPDGMKDASWPLCTSTLPPVTDPVPWVVSFYETGDINKDKTMRKTMNKMAEKYGNNPPKKVDGLNKKPLKVRVGAVDCSKTTNDCEKLGVSTLPTVRFYSSWAEPKDFDSFFDGDELKQFIDARLKEKPKEEKVTLKADMPEESGKAKEDL